MTTTAPARQRVVSAPPRPAKGSTAAARRAYARRARRERTWSERELTQVGQPIRAALRKVPFVLVLIAMLGAALIGVLVLNTATEKMGIETAQTRAATRQLNLQIEAVQQEVAALNGTAHIARRAAELGLVQADKPAIIVVGADGAIQLLKKPEPSR